jgi:hypothetical protein
MTGEQTFCLCGKNDAVSGRPANQTLRRTCTSAIARPFFPLFSERDRADSRLG